MITSCEKYDFTQEKNDPFFSCMNNITKTAGLKKKFLNKRKVIKYNQL
jgi:hypothetical protein